MAKIHKKLKRSRSHPLKKRQSLSQVGTTSLQNILQQALALHQAGRMPEAEFLYRHLLQVHPNHVMALHYLGILAFETGKCEVAAEFMRRVVSLQPDFAEAHYNLGNALVRQGKLKEALGSYRRALAQAPDYTEAHYNLGLTLQKLGKLEKAAASYRRALALKPNYVEALNNLGIVLRDQDSQEKAIACFRQAIALQPDYVDAHSNLLFSLLRLPGHTVAEYLAVAYHFGKIISSGVRLRFSDWLCPPEPERLCVGLVSGDLGKHPVGYFLENLLANMDSLTGIKLVAYPTTRREDELTARIRSHFLAWKPLVGMDDNTAARLIHHDGVHILLDLSGHTQNNRLPVFAYKPAPIQVSWLGYSASTGLKEMDYFLADPYVAPPNEEAHFTETIYRLPESYLCFTPPREAVTVGPLPALKEGRITFGCFNDAAKINDSVIALWARVLHAIPGSHLILKAKQFTDPGFCKSIRQRFAASDISEQCLQLESFIDSREKHFATFNRVDISLDPFPYNGTTTSIEGLWMGVPFITLRGDCFIGHVGESIARNAGLPDWIAVDEKDYVAKAVAFASDVQALAALRAGLRQQVLASPLFDGARFARNFEAAMWGMWKAKTARAKRWLTNDET